MLMLLSVHVTSVLFLVLHGGKFCPDYELLLELHALTCPFLCAFEFTHASTYVNGTIQMYIKLRIHARHPMASYLALARGAKLKHRREDDARGRVPCHLSVDDWQ